MSGVLFLAWRYLAAHRLKTAVMLLAMTLALTLPLATRWSFARFHDQWMARAEATPLVIGATGSRYDLALHALYFRGAPPRRLSLADSDAVRRSGHADPLPLLVTHTASGHPLVGITLDYLDWRGLRVTAGDPLALLGDCVVGARAARTLGLHPGDRLLTDPENVFDLAGAYPLNLHVAGILAPSGTADDDAVFVDLQTAWVVEGIAHGHQDVTRETDESVILERRGNEVVANAALVQYTTITDENRHTFHVHADPEALPLTAVIAVPHDDRARALLMGRYLGPRETLQVIEPPGVVGEILSLLVGVERLVGVAILAMGLVAALFLSLVAVLSVRLRRAEMHTLALLGCTRARLAAVHLAEYALVLVGAALLALVLGAVVVRLAGEFPAQLVLGG